MHKPIYVIVGSSEFTATAECKKLLDELVTPEERLTSLFNAEPDEVTAADVLDELRTGPLFGTKRIVIVKGADEFISKNRDLLERYFDNPSRCGILVLTVGSWPKNTKLAKKLSKTGALIRAAELKAQQLPQYAIAYANQKHAKSITRNAAGLLVELVGDDPGRLCSEVDKLALFIGSEKTVTENHIEALIGHNRLFNAFEAIAAMTQGNAASAVERLRRMFAADKEASYTVVGAFAYHLRRMFRAAAMMKKGVLNEQIASQLRLWGNKEVFLNQVQLLGLERIGRLLAELARIDYEIKTGQALAEVAIEQLVFKLAPLN